jgi:hypothetical protein
MTDAGTLSVCLGRQVSCPATTPELLLDEPLDAPLLDPLDAPLLEEEEPPDPLDD